MKAMISAVGLALTVLFAAPLASAGTAVGYWQTIDDETKKPKSHVQIEESGGVVTAKIIHIINPSKPNPTCDKCDGAKKGKPIIGMEFLWGLKANKDGKTWEGGKILDPAKGKVYDAKIWLENDNTLNVRGSWLMFGRTQTWHRIDKDGKRM